MFDLKKRKENISLTHYYNRNIFRDSVSKRSYALVGKWCVTGNSMLIKSHEQFHFQSLANRRICTTQATLNTTLMSFPSEGFACVDMLLKKYCMYHFNIP